MSAEYSLEILTPERQFFQGQVQAGGRAAEMSADKFTMTVKFRI